MPTSMKYISSKFIRHTLIINNGIVAYTFRLFVIDICDQCNCNLVIIQNV